MPLKEYLAPLLLHAPFSVMNHPDQVYLFPPRGACRLTTLGRQGFFLFLPSCQIEYSTYLLIAIFLHIDIVLSHYKA